MRLELIGQTVRPLRRAALAAVLMGLAAALVFPTSAAGDELPCCEGQTIRFLYRDGERGHVDLYRSADVLRFLRLETMQPNTHRCTLEASRTCVLTRAGSEPVMPSCPLEAEQEDDDEEDNALTNYDDKICRIVLTIKGDRLNVWYEDRWCRLFCGGLGEFAGDYERQPRLPARRPR